MREYINSGQVTYDLFEGHHHRYSKGYTSSLERFKHTAQVRQQQRSSTLLGEEDAKHAAQQQCQLSMPQGLLRKVCWRRQPQQHTQ